MQVRYNHKSIICIGLTGLFYTVYCVLINADRINHFYETTGGYRILPCTTKVRYNAMQKELLDVCRKLNEKNITYWLDDGTLLGMVREEQILRHDTDNDIGILYQDKKQIKEILGSPYYYERLTDIYRYEKYQQFIFRKCESHTIAEKLNLLREISRHFASEVYLPPKKLGGNGLYSECYIPANPDEILQVKYGPDYMDNTPCLPQEEEPLVDTINNNRAHASKGPFC